jgi:predicted NAD-dependent protein-ADP-ribosyltransferase YbiA (DUF1768 family)
MGGPCWLVAPGERRTPAPPCTDNYQLRRIEYKGDVYHSTEHAYQALKQADPARRAAVQVSLVSAIL